MFASIKPGGHFEQKRARPGKKALEKPSSESEKKKKINARGNRARRTPRDLYATTQTPPKHRPRTFRTRSNRSRRGDFARPNNQKMRRLCTRTACTNLPNFVHGVQTSLSSFPLPPPRPRPPPRPLPPLSPPRPRRSPLSPPRPKPRENPPLSDSSAIVSCFVFFSLLCVKK